MFIVSVLLFIIVFILPLSLSLSHFLFLSLLQQGDLLMAQFLLVFGANIDALNDQKKTPLDMLIHKGNDKKFFIVIEDLKRLDAKHGLEVVPVVREKHHSTRLMSISSDLPEKQEKLVDIRQSRRSESIGTGIEKPRALVSEVYCKTEDKVSLLCMLIE